MGRNNGFLESAEQLERNARDAGRRRGTDEEREAETQRAKSKEVVSKLRQLADQTGVDLRSASEADWDRLLRSATIDREKVHDPIFAPVVLYEHITSLSRRCSAARSRTPSTRRSSCRSGSITGQHCAPSRGVAIRCLSGRAGHGRDPIIVDRCRDFSSR
jgi:hypothetical protein